MIFCYIEYIDCNQASALGVLSNKILRKIKMKRALVSCMLSTVGFMSFSTLADSVTHTNLLMPEYAAMSIKQQIKQLPEAATSFEKWVSTPALEALTLEPMHFPHVSYERKDLKVRVDGIYALTLKWNLSTEDSERRKYFEKASELIVSIAKHISPGTHTPNESILHSVYEAYSLLRPEMALKDTEIVDRWLRRQGEYFKNYQLTGTLIKNNWENVRISILFNIALTLGDEELYDYSVGALKRFVKVNIEPDGKTNDFTNRDALTYHAYNQQYYGRILRAVKIYKGEEEAQHLFTYKEEGHGSIKDAYDFWKPYFTEPEKNVHIEFVNTGWKPDLKRGDANKPYSPTGTVYAMAHMIPVDKYAFTMIQKVMPGSEPYTLRLSTWLNNALHTKK